MHKLQFRELKQFVPGLSQVELGFKPRWVLPSCGQELSEEALNPDVLGKKDKKRLPSMFFLDASTFLSLPLGQGYVDNLNKFTSCHTRFQSLHMGNWERYQSRCRPH